jgi:hypothetical protein
MLIGGGHMPSHLVRSWPCALLLLFSPQVSPQASAPQPQTTAAAPQGSWKVLYEEQFEGPGPLFPAGPPAWAPDKYQEVDEYSDGGQYFQDRGVKPPAAFRAEGAFGKDQWLTAAGYSRTTLTKFSDLFEVVPDPADPTNHVLKVSSPQSTDGMIIRPTDPLPATYRVCLKVGYASFGDGKPGEKSLNGYAGGEKDEPWGSGDATLENGFYWLTILDATPRPHNNLWIHHHRKVVIDSDNNKEAWTNIWEHKDWVADGQHPIMMFGVDKTGDDNDKIGRPFLSWSHGALQPSGAIRAVDAYKDNTWYSACIERTPASFVLTVSGDFKWGGRQTYVGTIPLHSVYQADPGIPDFFMFGDPHNNYYRGSVYYDDIKLETWQGP